MSVPKKPVANYADTRNGTIHELEPSGLTPKYLHKKEYGKTPVYIQKRREEEERAQREYENYVQQSLKRGSMKCLSESERYELNKHFFIVHI